ncbi:MAG: 4Fe-4S dicluster domain-containing protein, partial [Bacteroidota bacterium]|nr:4Fe-4S dicluster domain-containing protein [Bacteroidota bacterium]
FTVIKSTDELNLDSSLSPTKISFKEKFFPKTETIFKYNKNGNGIQVSDPVYAEKKVLILGAKPCDAASIPILSKVFNWDYKDEFFDKRVANSIIIGLACNYSDENCFCTSVNLNQLSVKGSDLFLIPLSANQYILQVVTEKGNDFLNKYLSGLKPNSNQVNFKPEKEPVKKFNPGKVKDWLDKNFKSDFWEGTAELCLGCAQCAFVCPTCHCFDIVDEQCSQSCGRRIKNWDACQFGQFTRHASGHNPRTSQADRYRQRVSHKFKYYPDKFEEILCTGCGRCTRGCPVGIDISEVAALIDLNNKDFKGVE